MTKNLDEIRRIKEEAEGDLLELPGVVGVDVWHSNEGGEKNHPLAIRIYVENKQDVEKRKLIPKEIKGVPTEVVERRFEIHADN
jgi:hypothetical protein